MLADIASYNIAQDSIVPQNRFSYLCATWVILTSQLITRAAKEEKHHLVAWDEMPLSHHQTQLKNRFLALRGSWNDDWEAILLLNPSYFEGYINLQDASQRPNRLPTKIQELIYIAVAAACTHMHVPGIRAHVQAAITAGATADEIMEAIGLTNFLGVHTVTLGTSILMRLMEELGIEESGHEIDDNERQRIKDNFQTKRGFWVDAWNPILQLDPKFFEAYTDFSSLSSATGVLEPKYRELIIGAFDAATTHLHHRGTEIHMRNALCLGATPGQVVEMLEISSLMGIHGVTTAAPILAKQLGLQ